MQTQTSNALHNAIMEAGGKDRLPMLAPVPVAEGSSETTTERYMENYKNVSQDIHDQLNAKVEAKAIERLKQGELINIQDLETNLYWKFEKFTSRDGESLESYYSRSQQATKNRVKAIVNSSTPIYAQEPSLVTEDDKMSKEKEIDKLMALISLSFKKIYKPTNNNFRTSSNTNIANQDNSPRINRGNVYDNKKVVNVAGKPKRVKDAAYHKEKMLLCKQKEVGVQLNAEQADWKDDTDDESNDQELEAHYMYMAQIQEVTPDPVDNSGPIFDAEPSHKVLNNNDNYNVFAIENEHHEQLESVNDIYMEEQGDTYITIDSLYICYDREQDDQDDTDELDQERDLLASLIEKLKCEINDSKNRNKFLETSNKALVDKLREIDCAKAKGDLMSYKSEYEKSSNEYTRKINDLNQTILDMKKELFAHQETIFIMSQEKEAYIKLYKTREDKELDKVIALENKVKTLNDIVYKTGQSVQTMNMLNRNCKTSFTKPEFLMKAQRANPRMYDIGCYNDNLALMLSPESDETIRLAKESRSKISDLIRPIDYDQLNNLYDLFVPQREKLLREYYCADHMNAILGVYTDIDDKHAINLELDLQQCNEKMKNENSFKENQSKEFLKEREQYFEIQDLKAQLQDKGIAIRVIPSPSVSRPQLKSNPLEDRVMPNNSKTSSWWYLKFTPSGYKWKPKSPIGNVETNVSMPLGNAYRNTNILEPMTPRCSTMSNTPLSSNSFVALFDLIGPAKRCYYAIPFLIRKNAKN
uniref:Uncharacterized protein n=1 Tax=Tanacetum cinerariifolium TaxID=118510 RepID=A0A6L2KAK9_TANCI|nr:hypothetical protein [Tanacetum cinerariifolium]